MTQYILTCRNAKTVANVCNNEAISGLFQLAYNEADTLDEDVYVDVADELIEELDILLESEDIPHEKKKGPVD